ncbi:CDP-glycerol glycerophosphotransferase family protein [Clostridiales bacterium]|nr:CDP-glycerol glycerophosphotransferase family protein [Clostridiales bacterium]
MKFLIAIGRLILNGIYDFHKLCPVKNQVVIISRQSDEPSLDIRLLAKELESRQDIQVKVLCRTLGGGLFSKIKYLFHMIGPQMRAMATSKVVVLDSYCIAASILRHRKGLSIIQMWHAMGGFKKFGYSILDQGEGSQAWLAEAMRMHKNYTCVLASSEESVRFLGEAFGYDRDVFKILPLPRTDLLRDPDYMERKAQEIKAAIPSLSQAKKTILYAPTFRKTQQGKEGVLELVNAVNYEAYDLVAALHPLMDQEQLPEKVITTDRFSTMELLSVCDYFITDYSAMIYEAALAEKPIFLYAYDLRDYTSNRGFYIDYEKDLPGETHTDARELVKAIETDQYDLREVRAFAQRYVAVGGQCAQRLADLICEQAKAI